MYRGFELKDEEIRRLNSHEAVDFFRDLLWAEASETGVVQSAAHVPTRITVPDGGIDAKVEDADPSREDIIPSGISGFQIKSSDLQPNKCKKEVRDSDGDLETRIETLLDQDGTYVLVIFEELVGVAKRSGKDSLERRKTALKEEFADKGYPDAEVRIYDSSMLTGFVNRFPGLVAKYRGLDHVQDHSTWATTATGEIETFISDDARETQITTIRNAVRESFGSCSVIRVTGLPGVGKTRLVFEAISAEDLKNRVIYSTAREFDCSGVASRLKMDSEWSAIIVVDNCDPEDHDHFQRQFSSHSDRLALITISTDPTPVNADHHIEVKPLDRDATIEMLKQEVNHA